MKTGFWKHSSLKLAMFASLAFVTTSAMAQVVIHHPVGHDVSRALRDMPGIPPQWDNMNEHPVKPVPHAAAGGRDSVVQTTGLATTSATVTSLTGFNGVGVTSGYTISGEPPDTN